MKHSRKMILLDYADAKRYGRENAGRIVEIPGSPPKRKIMSGSDEYLADLANDMKSVLSSETLDDREKAQIYNDLLHRFTTMKANMVSREKATQSAGLTFLSDRLFSKVSDADYKAKARNLNAPLISGSPLPKKYEPSSPEFQTPFGGVSGRSFADDTLTPKNVSPAATLFNQKPMNPLKSEYGGYVTDPVNEPDYSLLTPRRPPPMKRVQLERNTQKTKSVFQQSLKHSVIDDKANRRKSAEKRLPGTRAAETSDSENEQVRNQHGKGIRRWETLG